MFDPAQNQTQSPQFFKPPTPEEEQLRKQKLIAQALQAPTLPPQQQQNPLGTGETQYVNGFAVPQSGLEAFSRGMLQPQNIGGAQQNPMQAIAKGIFK